MAILIPFLNGATMFFSVSPNFEANLMNELYNCYKYLKIPFDTLWNMSVRLRRYLINRHNKDVEEERGTSEGMKTSTDIDRFTDLEQTNQKNRGF